MVSIWDRESVGHTDMRLFRDWLQKAPPPIKRLATTHPPSIYRLTHKDGTVLRVFPERYYWTDEGELAMCVVAAPELNLHCPGMLPVRITEVPPDKLEPIKWPPDATVH